MNEEQKEKYSARNWIITSPQGRYNAIINWDKAVSLKKMESYFSPSWKMRPLFPGEKATAERKISRIK